MSALERLEDAGDEKRLAADAPVAEAATDGVGRSGGSARVRPLLALVPYVMRYRGRTLRR